MIINRALIREVLQTSGAVTLVMLSIFVVIRAISVLGQAAEGDIPIDSVAALLLLKLVTYMDVILPLILFIAILMVLGRWNRDNEMVVMAASGVGLGQFLKPMAPILVLGMVLVGGFSLFLAPLSVRVAEGIKQNFDNRSDIAGVVPGVFTETNGGAGVYFIESIDPKTGKYRNVFVYGQDNDREGVVFADTGFQRTDPGTNDQFLVLKDGSRYEGTPGEPSYVVVEFETYAIRLKQRAPKKVDIPVSGIATRYLVGARHHRLRTELQWRLSKPFTVPVLILFALALSNVDVRRSRLPNMLTAFLIYFTYTNILGLVVALMNHGRIASGYGLWGVHLVFAALAVYLFWRRAVNRPFLPALRRRAVV